MNYDKGAIRREMNKKKQFFMTAFLSAAVMLVLGLAGCRGNTVEFLEAGDVLLEEESEPFPETAIWTAEPSLDGAEKKGQIQQEVPQIYVDVCGAVQHPGVYELEEGSRVFQAIEAAGGFAKEAASAYINQAESLQDGQQIYVPKKQEVEELSLPMQQTKEQENGEAKVNLNTADKQELMTINGIGESRALDIIAYREEHGKFSAIEEIMNVQGIKEGTFDKIKEHIAVE